VLCSASALAALPLQDLIVVSLEQAVAVPFATRQLADLGARVIKIERPGSGDFARAYDTTVHGLASHFVWLNRTKESLTLDLKQPEGQDILARLVQRADVFVQNLGPGAADRLGLNAAALREQRPSLIVANLTGYGSTGPYASKKAYDLLIQSETGLVSITGTDDHPSKVGVSIADIAGGMYVYSGILTALLERQRTGCGTTVDVSLFDALGEWMGYAMYYTMGGSPPARTGASHATIAPYGPYRTSDGHVIFGVQSSREWTVFCRDVLGKPTLADDPRFENNQRRVENRSALDAEINGVFSTLTTVGAIERLDVAQIANARMNSLSEFIDHPQLRERQAWRQVESPVGPIPALVPPVRLEGRDPRMGAVPALGEHTSGILSELGFEPMAIERLRQRGVI
jgi:itaconate CoA-transferase